MRIYSTIILCFLLTSCYFGANESGYEIINDFYLVKWDNDTWISHSKDGDNIWNKENIIVSHNVFAINVVDDFIIIKQHPCENTLSHGQDFDDKEPNKAVINYFIIDSKNQTNKVNLYTNKRDFDNAKAKFKIPKNLPYKFYTKN